MYFHNNIAFVFSYVPGLDPPSLVNPRVTKLLNASLKEVFDSTYECKVSILSFTISFLNIGISYSDLFFLLSGE
jgi:hypothetical protein